MIMLFTIKISSMGPLGDMKTAYEHLSCTQKNNGNPRPLGLHTQRVIRFLVRTSRDAFVFVLYCTVLLYMRPMLLLVLLVTILLSHSKVLRLPAEIS